jgi:hypothetical protein
VKHRDQILKLLQKQIGNSSEVQEIRETAEAVVGKWVNPLSGGKEEINGLIYGLVQSGKTGVLTVTGAMGADEGYKTIIILTSDNDPLYDQTLSRVQEAFPGIDIIGKKDFKDYESFIQRIKQGICAIVTTKNSGLLKTLIENFKKGNVRGLTCLIIDDEADAASLNTKARKNDGTRSAINESIGELRSYFQKTTYLQVTATPQALFLQQQKHAFRPKFTVLSNPGKDYVGGKDFFGDKSKLVREFDIADITALSPGAQPTPRLDIPPSLLLALDTFMVAATFKRMKETDPNCAFLCHVSTRTSDHKHIVGLLRRYKSDLTTKLKSKNSATIKRLKVAYDDLSQTHPEMKNCKFDDLIDTVEFLSPGITVKLVNGETDEDVAVRSPYNLFVGGNKLGRGVTIKNLLVSYYGRHPRAPQADTVLQHARMYGYRRKDLGLLRLFLPPALHTVFRAITKMEDGLRELIAKNPSEEFRGIYLENRLNATRKNVLAPGALGIYSGGSNYNPSQVVRDESVKKNTASIDAILGDVKDGTTIEMDIEEIAHLISLTKHDLKGAQRVWDPSAIAESLLEFAKLQKHKTGFVYVARERGLKADRDETQGVISGGDVAKAPGDRIALFMLRTKAEGKSHPSWWPQVRFPDGPYGFAFAV